MKIEVTDWQDDEPQQIPVRLLDLELTPTGREREWFTEPFKFATVGRGNWQITIRWN